MMIKVFDFECNECGTVYEYWVKDDETPTCIVCGSSDLKKLPSATRTNWNKGPYDTHL